MLKVIKKIDGKTVETYYYTSGWPPGDGQLMADVGRQQVERARRLLRDRILGGEEDVVVKWMCELLDRGKILVYVLRLSGINWLMLGVARGSTDVTPPTNDPTLTEFVQGTAFMVVSDDSSIQLLEVSRPFPPDDAWPVPGNLQPVVIEEGPDGRPTDDVPEFICVITRYPQKRREQQGE